MYYVTSNLNLFYFQFIFTFRFEHLTNTKGRTVADKDDLTPPNTEDTTSKATAVQITSTKNDFIVRVSNDLSQNLNNKLHTNQSSKISSSDSVQILASSSTSQNFLKNRRQRPKSYVETKFYVMPSTHDHHSTAAKTSKDANAACSTLSASATANLTTKTRHHTQNISKNNLLSALMMPPPLPSNFHRSYHQYQSNGDQLSSGSQNNKLNHTHLSISDIKNFSSNLAGGASSEASSPNTVHCEEFFSTSAPYTSTGCATSRIVNEDESAQHVICKI